MPVDSSRQIVPRKVAEAMRIGGSTVTCMPVQLDHSSCWESAIFFRLDANHSKADQDALISRRGAVPVGIETDLIEHANATVVVLRLQIEAIADNSLYGEILLTSGGAYAHFEALKLLAQQPRLCWFFCDQEFLIIHSQEHPLADEHREEFADLLRKATTRDALIRASGKYDAHMAFNEIVEHYEFR